MGNKSTTLTQLQQLGLAENEALIIIELLSGPLTPMQISRQTSIARSNVYRLVDSLHKKGLVHEQITDKGKFFAMTEPSTLELLVLEQEKLAETKRAEFDQLLPLLTAMKRQHDNLSTRTYYGLGGTKQMLWNELTSKEILVFCAGSLDLGTGKHWAEKYRSEIIHRNISQRSIENTGTPAPLSSHRDYGDHYTLRRIPKDILNIQLELTIHDDTISIYNAWTHEVQLGTEIKNPFLATLMRQVFEHYWEIAVD